MQSNESEYTTKRQSNEDVEEFVYLIATVTIEVGGTNA